MSHKLSSQTPLPELLAPAGNRDCAKAAVANGADAVYFGLDGAFNARARAAGFSAADLPELLAFLHRNGVRGYVTLNTLAFSDELDPLESIVRQIAEAGADGVLVQDLGLVRMIRRIAPSLPIHASTQMTMTSAECIAVVEELGVQRVVLARELYVGEIARIHEKTSVELETFVHGALCVAYSGQCLTSESLGGRSANRGQCAQACRLPYELVCDGRDMDLGAQKYLLSPQDLAAYCLIPELMAAGVTAMKIEGRLKTPEYVANITRYYRQAIDAAVVGEPVEFTERQVEEMELSFSRGFSAGWLQGNDHKALVPGLSSAKRGVLVGQVCSVRKGQVQVALTGRLKAGDGVVFEGDRAAGEEEGGRVFTIHRNGKRLADEATEGEVELAFRDDAIDLRQIRPGQKLWKTDDPALTRRLRKSFSGDVRGRASPVRTQVTAAVGRALKVVATTEVFPPVTCASEEPLAEATKHPLTRELLEEQLGRLGGSGFALAELAATIEGSPMVPLSVLGKLRKELVARLQSAREKASRTGHATAEDRVLPRMREEVVRPPTVLGEPQLAVLCRSLDQLRAMCDHGISPLYADFQDIRQYGEAVSVAHGAGTQILLATPRIQKPGELGIFKALARHGADGILVRNLAGLDYFAQQSIACVADFSLNAANELTVDFLRQQGAARVTASYDLNREQLLEMVRHAPARLLEVVVHQHMPMFHMEHCVFCAVLSPGTNKTNCGRPCDRHEVRLRDRVGVEHPLQADVGCRNTVFNATAQSGAEVVKPLLELGVRHFRVELLADDRPEWLRRCVDLYRDLLAGKVSGQQVWTALKAVNRVGVTRGTLEHRRDPLAIL
ncbi:MAG: U32 family peptidase [Planctomycetaceae bacterium]|nr:U32 family peptidase [Planctomycetaceae bacterium]